jgi:hypothetical protein
MNWPIVLISLILSKGGVLKRVKLYSCDLSKGTFRTIGSNIFSLIGERVILTSFLNFILNVTWVVVVEIYFLDL